MMTMVTTLVTMMTKIMTMMRDKNAKMVRPTRAVCNRVKDHQDDCNDNSNVGDDRVIKMIVIVMTTTMTTPVMTMVTTVGPDDDNNNGDDDRSKNIPLHHQVPRTECRSVPRNVCNPVIFVNSLKTVKFTSPLHRIKIIKSNIYISGLHPNLLL